jgi:RHS repeat-associated protein
MTGLRNIEQRYYASTYGRFNTADPYQASGGPGNPASWNRYSYAGGDPVNRIDPRGLIYVECGGGDSGGDDFGTPDCGGGGGGVSEEYWGNYGGCGNQDPLSPFFGVGRVCEQPDQGGGQLGGGGGGASGPPTPDCNSITAAVGFQGLTYANALEIWNNGSLSGYGGDSDAANIAALAAVTWQGESGFGLNPINNPNYNDRGVLTSVDYGPFQINQGFHPNSNSSIWGTNGANKTFNGNPDANITFGISILEGLYKSYGNNAAGRYVGSLGSKRGQPTLGQKRENTWNSWKDKLQGLFSNINCFKHN